MEGNVAVDGDDVEKGKDVVPEADVTQEAASGDEVKVNENPDEAVIKPTRQRRPSKKALESADQEKVLTKSRKPKKPATLSNGVKCEEEMDTGHATRARSKSPRSTGSRSPRSSRSPRPAKEPVAKPVKKQKAPADKEKAKRPRAKKTTAPKPKAKEGDPASSKEEKPKPKRKRKRDPESQTTGETSPEKVKKTSSPNDEAANGESGGHDAVPNDVAAELGKAENPQLPMVPPKKRQRKKPETEGHLLLNSKKTKKTSKTANESSTVNGSNTTISSTGNKNQETDLERVEDSNDQASFNTSGDVKNGVNTVKQNHSERSDLKGPETKPKTQNCALNGEPHANDPAKPLSETVLLDSELAKITSDLPGGKSSTVETQNDTQKDGTIEMITNKEGNSESLVKSTVANVVLQPKPADVGISAAVPLPEKVVPPKKRASKKKDASDGQPVKERKKKVTKGADAEKADGDPTEGAPAKPKRKRAKKADVEKEGEEATDGAVAPVKEKKKRVRKTNAEKVGEGAAKEKKKRVKKTENKPEVAEGAQAEEGKEGVGGENTVPPAKEKKKRVYKKKADKVEGVGEGVDGAPVKEKKKRVRKPKKVDSGDNKTIKKGDGVKKTDNNDKGNTVQEQNQEGGSTKEKEACVEEENLGKGDGSVRTDELGETRSADKPSEQNVEKETGGKSGAAAEKNTVSSENSGGSVVSSNKKVADGEKMGGEGIEKKKRKRKSEDGEGGKQPVMCEKCGFIAGSKAALKKHDVRCHNEDNEDFVKENPFKCSICEYRAKKLSVIKRHVKKHGLEMCRFCEFVGENKILETHVRSEHRKTIKCKKCQRLINMEDEDYDQHVENCQGQHEYKCDHCGKEFKYKSTLKVHQITHDASLPKRFNCEHCDYQSHFKANLQKHIESKHSADRQRSIPCPVCEKLYYSEANMKKHLKNHTDERLFQCPKCDKAFKVADVLRDHLVTHSEDNPFKCEHEDCDRTFKYRKLLKTHMLETHRESQKKLRCSHPGCGLEFFKKSHLRRHETTHTGDRNYQCTWPDCGKAFRHADNLKVHYRQHTNEKPIQCTLCDFACRQRNSLSWHMKRYHNPEATASKKEKKEVKDETKIETESVVDETAVVKAAVVETTVAEPVVDLKLPRDDDEASNHSTDSSATIEITPAELGSLADVIEMPLWQKVSNESVNSDSTIPTHNDEIKDCEDKASKENEPVVLSTSNDTDKVSKPKTVRKPRKPRAKKEKAGTPSFKSAVNGAIGVENTGEKLSNDTELSSQNVAETKASESVEQKDGETEATAVPKAKPKRKRRTKAEMAAAKAEAQAAKAAKAAAVAAGEPPKKRRRKKDEAKVDADPPAPPVVEKQVEELPEEEPPQEDFVDLSYPYKEKRPPKGKRLLNPDKIKEVEKGRENIYDFDSDDESRGNQRREEQLDDACNFDNTHGQLTQEEMPQMQHMPVTNYHDVPKQAEMMLNPATGHMVEDLMRDKAVLPPRLLSDVVVALSPLDLDKIDRRELLETRENVRISESQNPDDDGLKDGISASDIERDVREIIEKDSVGVAASGDLHSDAQIFVDNNEEFPDRSDGEIIDRHLLQKYLEDTNMDDFERDLMKEEEKAVASRNQFDDYVSPERQPMSVQPSKPDAQFDNYVSPDRQPMSVQPMKPESQFENYVSPDRGPMSVQPMKPDVQFDNYRSPEQQPRSVQPTLKPDQYDKYMSPEHVQVMSNQSAVNHDTVSLPSNASQHGGDTQWKSVEPNKNSVIGAMESSWTTPTESEKQVETEARIFDPYATEKGSALPPLPEKSAYSDHLDPGRDSSAYRIPDYGSMYDTTTRMLASGLSSYPPVSSDSPHGISRPSTSFDPKDVSSLGYSQTPTPYLQSSGLYGANMNPPSNSYIDPRVDPYASSQLPSHPGSLQARDNPLNSLAISASKYIESEINKTRVYNQQGWTLQETQSLRLTHSLFPQRNNDWEASSRPPSSYSYFGDRDMPGYNTCSTGRPPALSDRLSAGYLSGQTAESLEKQAFERYDMANYLNSRHAGIPQPPSFNFDRPLSSSAKAFTDSYRGASSIPDYRGLSHPATPELYAPNLNLDKYFYSRDMRDSMYAPQRVPLPSENPFLSQTNSAAQPNLSSREYPRGSVYSQPGPYPLMDNGKYSDPGKFAQPISSMQGREFYLPRPGSAAGHIQDPYRAPMLYNMMNRYFE